MNTRRTGITFLLAGLFAVVCLHSDAFAAPRASQTRHAPPPSDSSVANIETILKDYKENEQKLQNRIRDLEEAQQKLLERTVTQSDERENLQKLQARIFDLENERAQLLEQSQSDVSFNWLLGGASLFTLALCVILLLRMNRPKTGIGSWPQPEPTAPAEVFPAPATEPAAPSQPFSTLPDWDTASPALNLQSLKSLAAKGGTPYRSPAIELAEIMLSYGRVNSAAEALANYIETSPKGAFAPWLKLLEVYRANGQRSEFDKIAHNLNKTFNVWTVDWDNFSDSLAPSHGLDAMPHIMSRLQKLWDTRECQAYLQYLLRDTRSETRQGFSLAAIDDILCLSDVLESHLGPYTGPPSDFDDDFVADTAPVTESSPLHTPTEIKPD
ncbi:MAG: hypothetical protein LBU76_05250 [Azoarcus sp.]|jgi:TolA-binding protein|nr:hypothetical protein [Azoarcus sp.]